MKLISGKLLLLTNSKAKVTVGHPRGDDTIRITVVKYKLEVRTKDKVVGVTYIFFIL